MKTAVQIELTFEQILSLIKQLPINQKQKISKELQKEGIEVRFEKLLNSLKTDELDLETIDEEVELVRSELYEKQIS